jgi:hypothetical protein
MGEALINTAMLTVIVGFIFAVCGLLALLFSLALKVYCWWVLRGEALGDHVEERAERPNPL